MSILINYIFKLFSFFKILKLYLETKKFESVFKNNTCEIGYNVKYYNSSNIFLGKEIFFGDNVLLNAAKGGTISIGDNTSLASDVKILSWIKDSDEKNREIKIIKKDVKIGRYCRLGYNVIIMPGVNIGDNVKISPSSVVANDVPSNSIVLGNPAEIIS